MRNTFYVVNLDGRYIVRDKSRHRTIICTSNKEWVLKNFKKFAERNKYSDIDTVLDGLMYRNNELDKEVIKRQFKENRDEEMELEIEKIAKEVTSLDYGDDLVIAPIKKAKPKVKKRVKKEANDMIEDIKILI